MNDLRNTLQLSLICRQKESSLSCSGSPVYERLSIPPQLQWWHCTWWAAHGGLTVCIHFHGTSSASLLSLYRSFVGILGMGISNIGMCSNVHQHTVLRCWPSFSSSHDGEANFLHEEKKLLIWSPKELDYHLVLEVSYYVHPILLHV